MIAIARASTRKSGCGGLGAPVVEVAAGLVLRALGARLVALTGKVSKRSPARREACGA